MPIAAQYPGSFLEIATYGRKTASIFIMDSDHVILSALPPERFSPKEQEGEGS